ncbi:hypothetical protein VCHA48O428_110156 [Vibrio chagasii]|nr:hypothetical protein VCHA48O428_110156 [Vibrio chagasii]
MLQRFDNLFNHFFIECFFLRHNNLLKITNVIVSKRSTAMHSRLQTNAIHTLKYSCPAKFSENYAIYESATASMKGITIVVLSSFRYSMTICKILF